MALTRMLDNACHSDPLRCADELLRPAAPERLTIDYEIGR